VAALAEWVRRESRLADPDFDYLERQLAAGDGSAAGMDAAETMFAATLSVPQTVRWLKSIRGNRLLSPVNVLAAVERQGLADDVALPLLDYLTVCIDAGQTLPVDRLAALQNALPATRQAGVQPLLDRIREAATHQKRMLAAYEPLLADGDGGRGRALFHAKAQCAVCHPVWGIGGKSGPDLTKIGSIRAGRDILEAIVFPSATIAQGYEMLTVNLNDGETVTGIRVGKTDDPLILRDAAGNETRHARETIASIDRSALSLMPDGLLQMLSRDEIRDLLAFLQGLK
jgi:putative heme-binding domain-containing protein